MEVGADRKLCKRCGKVKSLEDGFKLNSNGYWRAHCRECENEKRKEHRSRNPLTPEQKKAARARASKLESIKRAEGIDLHRWILKDCRGWDRKHGFQCNLTKEMISELLQTGECSYCGTRDLRLTLDRIDNNIGHVTDNVVVACIRCNLIRGSMPYAAWQLFTPVLREIVAKNLFGNWRLTSFSKRKSE